MSNMLLNFPCAWGQPKATAFFKSQLHDFIVEEELAFSPESDGEHVFLFIEKQGQNTAWVARQLAIKTGVHKSKVSYAGLKDRYGITRQWFSIHSPGKRPVEDFTSVAQDITGIKVLKAQRHTKKLQRGALKGNHFTLRLRDYQGDRQKTEQRLKTVAIQGVPNYFGYQRFGHNGNNLTSVLAMFRGERKVNRPERSILLSAARSFIFNTILAKRVENETWNCWQPGDVVTFPNSQSLIFPHKQEANIIERCQRYELLLTAPLWGQGNLSSTEAVNTLESTVAENYKELCLGLENAGMQQERRTIQLLPYNLNWAWKGTDLCLSFSLNKGSYATTLLKELVTYTDVS